jgi:hypothetical protein
VTMKSKASDIHLSPLVDSLEASLDTILQLWNELRMLSLEAIQMDSDGPDLFTFSDSCLLIASIMKTTSKDSSDSAASTSRKWKGRGSTPSPFSNATKGKQLQIASDHPLDHITGAAFELPSEDTQDVVQDSSQAIGLIYCIPTSGCRAVVGEVSIGIILDYPFRGKGYARKAVELILEWAFETVYFRRVQAAIIDNVGRDKSMALFTQL